VLKICQVCGGKFEDSSRAKQARFCSDNCRKRASRRKAANPAANGPRSPIEANVTDCRGKRATPHAATDCRDANSGIFLRISDYLALGFDWGQWIVYKARWLEPLPLNAALISQDWNPIAFVSSTRKILFRCLREEAGFDLPGRSPHQKPPAKFTPIHEAGLAGLMALPSTFAEWQKIRRFRFKATGKVEVESVQPNSELRRG
jgi:hypothetical protein